ncbi:hypothetical protein ACFQ3Z_02530 [Streptomyces nogalater]
MSEDPRIIRVDITPVAFKDPALLNAVGVHEPYALRAVVEVTTDQGIAGLGETYADEDTCAGCARPPTRSPAWTSTPSARCAVASPM